MNGEIGFFEVVKLFMIYLSPLVVFVGFLLLLYGNYRSIEETLSREISGVRKKMLPKLENNIYSFHEWLLEKRILTGVIFIVCGVVFYFVGKAPC
jgi:hypothetical protein